MPITRRWCSSDPRRSRCAWRREIRALITALARAVRQVDDPVFLRVLLTSALLAAGCFVALAVLVGWGLHHLLARGGVFAEAIGVAGGLGSLLLALWLFLPVAAAIATLFLEPICGAVERRWYPDLKRARGASILAQAGDALTLGAGLLGLVLLGLLLGMLLPGAGLLIGWAINGWAIGRGLFVAVAMRRMTRAEALALYRANRLSVLPGGVALAVASSVPLVNLVVPVIGTASMVHLVERARPSLFPASASPRG